MDAAQESIDRGYAAHHAGNLQLALDLYRSGADALRPLNQPLRLAHTVRHVADIQRQMNLLDEARANYAEALAIYRTSPETAKLDLANTLRGFALLSQSRDDIPSARAMWCEAGELYAAVGVQAGVDEAERRLFLFHNL
jgi:tetratricopeptide (TPR) repeat protein